MARKPEIAILGAGLQGSCIALSLAQHGCRVTLLEQDARAMNRASRRNEGKIHLGLIYAADQSFATAETQLRGALSFTPLLRQWIGPRADDIPVSTAFDYLVATDSLFTPEELAEHYARIAEAAETIQKDEPEANYLGRTLSWIARRRPRPDFEHRFNPGRIQAVFETEELAIDTDSLAEAVIAAIDEEPRIRFEGGSKVESVSRRENGFVVEGRRSNNGTETAFRTTADIVINATWESRFAIDSTVGLASEPGWLHRLKYRVMAKLPDSMRDAPSATMVLGRYGDVVVRPDRTAYLSWYPFGLRGWTHDTLPPAHWNDACRGNVIDKPEEQDYAARVTTEIANWYPDLAGATAYQVDAGAIVAYGTTDVDKRDSGLHDRTRIGVFHDDGYFSVDPGKLTTAPLYADEASDVVLSYLGLRKAA